MSASNHPFKDMFSRASRGLQTFFSAAAKAGSDYLESSLRMRQSRYRHLKTTPVAPKTDESLTPKP
jgi:hypothetical protein